MTDKGVEFEAINYLEEPLSAGELKKLLRSAGLRPSEALRTAEPEYKQFVVEKKLSDDELIQVMAKHPQLIQRPIVVKGRKAVLARPTEKLKDLDL